jgi:plastocyanin
MRRWRDVGGLVLVFNAGLSAAACDRHRAEPIAAAALEPPVQAPELAASTASAPSASIDDSALARLPPHTIAGQVLEPSGGPARDAIVYVVDAPRAEPLAASAPHARVEQLGKTFVPHVLPVLVGTTVDFPNGDSVLHNVYSRSAPRSFDLGMYGAGPGKSVRLEQPGRIDVFCAIHTNMHSVILIRDNPYFAVVDARGAFEIRDVPAGSYTLALWSDGRPEQSEPVRVSGSEPTIVRARFK